MAETSEYQPVVGMNVPQSSGESLHEVRPRLLRGTSVVSRCYRRDSSMSFHSGPGAGFQGCHDDCAVTDTGHDSMNPRVRLSEKPAKERVVAWVPGRIRHSRQKSIKWHRRRSAGRESPGHARRSRPRVLQIAVVILFFSDVGTAVASVVPSRVPCATTIFARG